MRTRRQNCASRTACCAPTELAPEWVSLGQDVNERRTRLLRRGGRQDAEELTRLNRDILRYNLMAPSGVPRKALLAPDS